MPDSPGVQALNDMIDMQEKRLAASRGCVRGDLRAALRDRRHRDRVQRPS
jgi:hypothetical protein